MSKHEHRTLMQDGAEALGNGTPINCPGHGTCTVQITGITSATVTFEATLDGANWVAVLFTNLNTGNAATTATADGIYRASCAGFALVRARISTYASGTIYAHGRVVPFST